MRAHWKAPSSGPALRGCGRNGFGHLQKCKAVSAPDFLERKIREISSKSGLMRASQQDLFDIFVKDALPFTSKSSQSILAVYALAATPACAGVTLGSIAGQTQQQSHWDGSSALSRSFEIGEPSLSRADSGLSGKRLEFAEVHPAPMRFGSTSGTTTEVRPKVLRTLMVPVTALEWNTASCPYAVPVAFTSTLQDQARCDRRTVSNIARVELLTFLLTASQWLL